MDRFGWISPKLVIGDTLQAGYDALYAALSDDAQIDAYLKRAFWGDGAAMVARRLRYRTFLRSQRKIDVLDNYPRESQKFPCHAVVLGGGKSKDFLGNVGPETEFPDGSVGAVAVERWTGTIGVMTYAENPEELELHHQLAKLMLAGMRLELSELFEDGFELEEQDLGFNREMRPHFVYHRVLQAHVEHLQYNAAPPVGINVDAIATQLLTQEDDPDA